VGDASGVILAVGVDVVSVLAVVSVGLTEVVVADGANVTEGVPVGAEVGLAVCVAVVRGVEGGGSVGVGTAVGESTGAGVDELTNVGVGEGGDVGVDSVAGGAIGTGGR
jgi:hypothetical protein